MTMTKYGVSDRKQLQESELRTVKARLRTLRSSHEKTASDTQDVARLEARETALSATIQSHDQGASNQ